MQIHSLNHSTMGKHTGDASAIGRSYLEQVHRLPWATLTGASGAGWQIPGWAAAPPTIAQVNGPQGVVNEQTYTVNWRVSAVAGSTCLLDVEIQVNWQEEAISNNKNLNLATRRYNYGGAAC